MATTQSMRRIAQADLVIGSIHIECATKSLACRWCEIKSVKLHLQALLQFLQLLQSLAVAVQLALALLELKGNLEKNKTKKQTKRPHTTSNKQRVCCFNDAPHDALREWPEARARQHCIRL